MRKVLRSFFIARRAMRSKAISNEHSFSWSVWTTNIVQRVANKEKLRLIVDRRIEALQFTIVVKIDEYVDQALAIYNLIKKVYGSKETSRVRELVHKYVSMQYVARISTCL